MRSTGREASSSPRRRSGAASAVHGGARRARPSARRDRRPRAPTASTRPRCSATSTGARPAGSRAAGCCASGRWSPATRRSRSPQGSTIPPGPTTAGCRGRPCAAARGTCSGSASSTAPPIRTRSTSTASIPAEMDGVPGIGAGLIESGKETTYEFDAEPFGMHLYHCHAGPLAEHIARGLYGAFIVDPKQGRDDADELVMVMNGFNTNFDAEGNQVYGVNTVGLPLRRRADQGRARRAGADLPGRTCSSSTRSTRSTSTRTSSTTTRPGPR